MHQPLSLLLALGSPSRPDQGRDPHAHFQWVVQVVGEEDYKISQSIQKSLETGLRPFNTLGRNEPALIRIHEALARGASDESCRIR